MIDYQEVSEAAQPFGGGDLTGGDRVHGLTFGERLNHRFQRGPAAGAWTAEPARKFPVNRRTG